MALKQYVSRKAGLYIPLPERLQDKENGVIALKFKTGNGSIVRVEREDWQQVIEGVPLMKNSKVVLNEVGQPVYKQQPNRYWKTGDITILPTEEELKARAIKAETDKHAAYVKRLIDMGVIGQLPDESFPDGKIRELAKSIGVQTADTEGNKLTKAQIITAIWAAFNLEYTKQKGNQKDEK
jgi:hypothetical protein